MKREDMQKRLERYAPILRFAPGERFYPIEVKRYLQDCCLYRRAFLRDKDITGEWDGTGDGKGGGRLEALGHFADPDCYLQLTQPTVGWGCVLVYLILVAGVAATALRLLGSDAARWVLGFGLASLVLGRLTRSKAGSIFLAATLLGVPLGWLLWRFSAQVVGGQFLSIFVVVYLVLVFLVVVFTAIRYTPALIVEFFSRATDEASDQAHECVKDNEHYVCYGRVTREGDWTLLHYAYFYAFNDWRKTAEGINHHEGDWEAITVFLKGRNPEPYGVAFSQHHHGVFRYWRDVHRARVFSDPRDVSSYDTYHPIAYVALGSHANYPEPDVVRVTEMFEKGVVQTIVYFLDELMRWLAGSGFATEVATGRGVRLAVSVDQGERYDKAHEDRLLALEPERYTVLSLQMQEALRDVDPALRGLLDSDATTRTSLRLRISQARQQLVSQVRRPSAERQLELAEEAEARLEIRLLPDPLPGWINYQGLWGVKSLLKDESGPPGPKWDREVLGAQFPRLRWGWPLKWLEILEEQEKARLAEDSKG